MFDVFDEGDGSPLQFFQSYQIQSKIYMLRYFTTGESHGEALVAVLSGLPAGLKVDQGFLDRELWRRQQGYGRGGRMKIESDTVSVVSGVRQGRTIGSPIAMIVSNADWKNWTEARYRPHSVRRTTGNDDRIAHLYLAGKQGLEELAGIASGRQRGSNKA